jgi:hypothetical protein
MLVVADDVVFDGTGLEGGVEARVVVGFTH